MADITDSVDLARSSFSSDSTTNDTRITLSSHSDDTDACSDHSVLVSVVAGSTATTAAAADAVPTPAPSTTTAPTSSPARSLRWKLINYLLIPACLPLMAAYLLLCLLGGLTASFMIWPSLLLARQLYWACPFIPHIWRSPALRAKVGVVGSRLLRLQFEGAHCATVVSRLLSLPLRPHLPDFYLLGFPKCGTTSMAGYLSAHPGISGLAGMPGNETFQKESHFFGGILGRGAAAAASSTAYRSFFPTILTRWWAEAVVGVPRWLCFDACPTSACLPYVAARAATITPDAKLVVMVRDPVSSVFSAETMLRGMGAPLTWSLAQPLAATAADNGSSSNSSSNSSAAGKAAGTDALEGQEQQDVEAADEEGVDSRFKFTSLQDEFWTRLAFLPVDAPLPADLPARFYFDLHSYLTCGRYADRLEPWIKAFGRDRLLLVDFKDFVSDPEATVRRVLDFVGTDNSRYTFTRQPPRMVNDYKGATVDPGVAAYLRRVWFADSSAALEQLMQQQQQQQRVEAGQKGVQEGQVF